jgi:hypothetical protein
VSYAAIFFVDTTFTKQDPFFKKYFSRKLVDLCKATDECIIVMSRVVYEESKKKLVEKLSELQSKLKADVIELADLLPADVEQYLQTSILDIDSIVIRYENFIHELEEAGALEIVDPPDGIMSELIRRAVHGIKPFGHNKDEFRDAVTWLTYVAYAKANPAAKCYFITNNTSDFYDKTKTTLHPDLRQDCNRFVLYKTTKDMFSSDEDIPELEATAAAQTLFDSILNKLSNQWVLSILRGDLASAVLREVSQRVEAVSLYQWDDTSCGGWISVGTVDVHETRELYVDLDGDTVTVFGKAKVILDCTGYYYNPVHDDQDDKFEERSMELEGEIEFSFRVVNEDVYDNFEIHDDDIRYVTYVDVEEELEY